MPFSVYILRPSLLAPVLAPHDPYEQDLFKRLLPPFWMDGTDPAHPLGTDNLGRDYLSRLIYGAQISLLIGVCTALLSGIIGSALGITAGYFGGRVDTVITFIITTRLSMPIVLVALAVVALVGGSLEAVILVLGFLLVGSADRMWLLYTVAFAQATVGTFFLPAKNALVPAIVERDDLLAANSLSETSRVIFMLLGTAAAGIVAGLSGSMAPVFVVDAASFALSAALLVRISADTRPAGLVGQESVWADVWLGVATMTAESQVQHWLRRSRRGIKAEGRRAIAGPARGLAICLRKRLARAENVSWLPSIA